MSNWLAILVGAALWAGPVVSQTAAPAKAPAPVPAPATGKAHVEGARGYAGLTISLKAPGGNRYVGSQACGECHKQAFLGWTKTFHSTVIQDARANPAAILADFSATDLPFTREEVEYTIGSHWDQRYMKRMGEEYFVLPRLWSIQAQEWRPYSVWSWNKRPYSQFCAGCHTTNYDPKGRTIAEEGIGCEACHGPGGFHAESSDPARIINPAKLSIERYNMICAACHVRGMDKSGEYYFPVGYSPGNDLTESYVPIEMKEGETVRGAISRIYREWQDKKVQASRARCEVCGIAGTTLAAPQKDDLMNFCFGCHSWKSKLQLHTRHPDTVTLVCTQCHVQRDKKTLNDSLEGNIHSYSYFMVHTENCYDPEIEKACLACHKDKQEAWAVQVLKAWKKPVDVGH